MGTSLRIASVYPDLLGTYGDGGNATILASRASWRGVPVDVVSVGAGEPLPRDCDIYLLGGGEDEPQALAAAGIAAGGALGDAVDRGAVLVAVCAGLQIIGTTFPGSDGTVRKGAEIVDVSTAVGPARAVGDLVVEPRPGSGLETLFGYENHRGRTTLGPGVAPLGTVRRGIGNGAGQLVPPDFAAPSALGVEGLWVGRGAGLVVGTYLHGPVFAQNPQFADAILNRATGGLPPAADDPRLVAANVAAARLRAARARQTGRR